MTQYKEIHTDYTALCHYDPSSPQSATALKQLSFVPLPNSFRRQDSQHSFGQTLSHKAGQSNLAGAKLLGEPGIVLDPDYLTNSYYSYYTLI